MKHLGIISYAYPHLKTEQVLLHLHRRIAQSGEMDSPQITVYALPFTPRTPREVLIAHRPNQVDAVSPDTLCKAFGYTYCSCVQDTEIGDACDLYLVTGAGILSPNMVTGKKILNCHPGIVPAARGLDAFKWSIYHMEPLGVTLHYIDENVDMGTVVSIVPTPVFSTDSLSTLARRHYENEISVLGNYDLYLKTPENPFFEVESRPATRRMPLAEEREMCRRFEAYKEKYALA